MWIFHVVADIPVSVEVGDDMITWSGQGVQLAGSIDDDRVSDLTYARSADPNDGVVFDPNEFEMVFNLLVGFFVVRECCSYARCRIQPFLNLR